MKASFSSHRDSLPRPQILLFADSEVCSRKERSVLETLRLAFGQHSLPELCVILRLQTKLQKCDSFQIGKIKTACADAQVMLVAHNDPIGAMEYELDGVHISSSFDVMEARRRIGKERWLSRSCHIDDSLNSAPIALCNGVTISPVFRPISKPNDRRSPLGLDVAATWSKGIGVATFALGGLLPRHIPATWGLGLSGIAILGSVMEADNPGETLMEYTHAIRNATNGSISPHGK
jgi:thiamine monophosphate synthase